MAYVPSKEALELVDDEGLCRLCGECIVPSRAEALAESVLVLSEPERVASFVESHRAWHEQASALVVFISNVRPFGRKHLFRLLLEAYGADLEREKREVALERPPGEQAVEQPGDRIQCFSCQAMVFRPTALRRMGRQGPRSLAALEDHRPSCEYANKHRMPPSRRHEASCVHNDCWCWPGSDGT